LKADQLFPGQRVSVDHFVSSAKGRRVNTFGKESAKDKHVGGCIFVDHSSGRVHVELQSHLNSRETLRSKKEHETLCSSCGVVIQEYLSDNGTAFRNAAFTEHLSQF